MLDPTTWGKSPACHLLSVVLEEVGDKSLAKDVCDILYRYNVTMKRVDKIVDGKEFFGKLALEHHQRAATIKLGWSGKVHDIVNNIMMARWRVSLKKRRVPAPCDIS